VSLRDHGYPEDRLRLVVLRDTKRDLAHAVLAFMTDGEAWILDNMTNALRTDRELPHYVPYYSVNASVRWAHVTPLESAVAARNADSRPAGDGDN
jgi:predicted transglutaminase-like cysteine proteinase